MSWPFGPNHELVTLSPLLTTEARIVVQVKTTVFSLMHIPVSAASVILGVGTAYHEGDRI